MSVHRSTKGRNYHIGQDLEIQNDVGILYKQREEISVMQYSDLTGAIEMETDSQEQKNYTIMYKVDKS